ncbi:MAG: hypothetical protein HY431_01840 [Candidatus Levybacteria bacterium]|nr:hypothetical protein [Candidatus Levybacteria bacterium]
MSASTKEITPRPTEQTPLSETDMHEKAFGLIQDFRDAFRIAPDFGDAVVQSYLGQRKDGFYLKPAVHPNNTRKVGFNRGKYHWEIDYSFREDSQKLRIEKYYPSEGDGEVVVLQSKRFEDVASTDPAEISYHLSYIPFDVWITKHVRCANDRRALDKAQKMLEDFKTSSPVTAVEEPVLHNGEKTIWQQINPFRSPRNLL